MQSRGGPVLPIEVRAASMKKHVALMIASIAMSGCQQNVPSRASSESIVVPVSMPMQRNVTEYVEYTGRTDALETVNLKARVTGYITSAPPLDEEGTEID